MPLCESLVSQLSPCEYLIEVGIAEVGFGELALLVDLFLAVVGSLPFQLLGFTYLGEAFLHLIVKGGHLALVLEL